MKSTASHSNSACSHSWHTQTSILNLQWLQYYCSHLIDAFTNAPPPSPYFKFFDELLRPVTRFLLEAVELSPLFSKGPVVVDVRSWDWNRDRDWPKTGRARTLETFGVQEHAGSMVPSTAQIDRHTLIMLVLLSELLWKCRRRHAADLQIRW